MTPPNDTPDDQPRGIDLAEFETRLVLRQLLESDLPRLQEMQRRCFPGMGTWTGEAFTSQLKVFPEGQVGIEHDGELVASASSLIIDFDEYRDRHTWAQIADNGLIRNHDPEADTLYGIEIMVHPDFRGLKLARRLYEARKQIARERNLRRIIIAGRLPGYAEHAERLSPAEYAGEVVEKKLFDPVLTTQLSNGFALRELVRGYYPMDAESGGNAAVLEWVNLEHSPTRVRRFRAVTQARLCLVQYMMRRVASFEDFAQQCEYLVDVGSDYKSDFVVFPELFTTQLLCLVDSERPAEAARALAEYTPRYLELFNELAIKYNVNIIGGSNFAIEDGHVYNIAYLFRRDGTIGRQYKIHITPNEARWWGVRGGSDVQVFDTDRGRIAILICYDSEFPELARVAAAKGAQLLFVPFNTDERHGYLRVRCCSQARAIENQMYVAIAGCAGMMPFVDNADIHYAQCAVLTPSDFQFSRDGVASESMPNIETVVVCDVDLELLRRARLDGTVRPWTDRRRDLYGVRYTDADGQTGEY